MILKQISPPAKMLSDLDMNRSTELRSHQRKLHSYQVELHFYTSWNLNTPPQCRTPDYLASHLQGQQIWLLLEDLDKAGYTQRKHQLTLADIKSCVNWLAHFHAAFLGQTPKGLWEVGCYWHLATRPDELQALADPGLKAAAEWLDQQLAGCRYQTLVHGDAKPANFCFGEGPQAGQVAAVDFQYVGGGCGIKDLVYLLDASLSPKDCLRYADQLLDMYFQSLCSALQASGRQTALETAEFAALEAEWRWLYPLAWADFYRFLLGWAPGSWGQHAYSQQQTDIALARFRQAGG